MKSKFQQMLAVAIVAAMSLVPAQAYAVAPAFAAGGTTFKNDLLVILSWVFGFAIIACGVMAWFGKMSWGWVAGLIIGAVFVFGNDQIVLWVRSSFMI